MEKTNNCCGEIKSKLSRCNMDMTIRECVEACGCDAGAVEKFLKSCCKK